MDNNRKELVDWVRGIYHNLDDVDKQNALRFFPELRESESEDERIRKALVWHLKADVDFVSNGVTKAECITYLEKQKEQKPNIELIQRAWYMEGYHDRKFNREPKWIITTGEGGPRYLPNPKYGQQVEEPKSAEWSKKDKEAIELIAEHLDNLGNTAMADILRNLHPQPNPIVAVDAEQLLKILPQKQEWTKEDEKMRNLAIEWAETVSGQFSFVGMDSTDFRKIIAWLKSLRPQHKQDWSEKDEKIWKDIFELCNRFGYDDACRLLKSSLRPSWKPSQEQMDALKKVAYNLIGTGTETDVFLVQLYEDLKKL